MAKGIQEIGVSRAVRQVDIEPLTEAEQDQLIRQVFIATTDDLADFVGRAVPRSVIRTAIQGPHEDPILGKHWVQVVSADFALDDLPSGCAAYRVWVSGTGSVPDHRGPTERGREVTKPEDDLRLDERQRYRDVYRERFGRYPGA